MMNNEKIVWVPIEQIIPNPKNPNKHSQAQIDRLVKIITYQGWRQPLSISNQSGYLNTGHGRLMAAKQMGLKTVPVLYQDFEDEDQEYANMISDNGIASWAELDLAMINDDMQYLDGHGFDIELLGLKDFDVIPDLDNELQDKPNMEGVERAYMIEVTLPTEDEMMALYNELLNRGLIVKVK